MITFPILNIIQSAVLFSKMGSAERYLREMLHENTNERYIMVSIFHTVDL
mgnify:CR=1 FL=1